MLAKFTY